jgi:hypothetical protein
MSKAPSFSYKCTHSGQSDTTPLNEWNDSTSRSQAIPVCTINVAEDISSSKLHSRPLTHLILGTACFIKRRNQWSRQIETE